MFPRPFLKNKILMNANTQLTLIIFLHIIDKTESIASFGFNTSQRRDGME